MINSSALLTDLKAQLKVLQADLKERADDSTTTWGARLQQEHAEALRRERTGLSWTAWRDNEVDQAAVAWIVATTFVRFCEDNDLLVGATLEGLPTPIGWIAGPGERTRRAVENQDAYFRDNPTHNSRDWLWHAFRILAAQPAGAALVDPKHNPVWTADVSADAAKSLVTFWRRSDAGGDLFHDFTDPDLDTRFLGDLYQDLSEHAKQTYALLQTPVFVEQFILDRTLTPAIAEFGVDGLKLIDPTCGSGHFLLGAFERLNHEWAIRSPGLDPKQRVRKSMDSIHGVDLNPFAVAISRFRLTVAGIQAAGEKSLVGVPTLGFHLAIGDSLLGEQGGSGDRLFDDGTFDLGIASTLDAATELEDATYTYATEDVGEYFGILKPGLYHVVVGNPPYITVKDPAASARYRRAYATASGTYPLSVPFMELFFRLAIRGEVGHGAGYIGQITSNSFMKRDFGKKLIEDFLAGRDPDFTFSCPVDLTCVIDSAGAWMPGHNHDGTPTVILVGRKRRPVAATVRAVLKNRDDPGKRVDPENGPNWLEIVANIDNPGFDGTYVSVVDMAREKLATFPWTLSGGVAADTRSRIEQAGVRSLASLVDTFGYTGQTNSDGAFLAPSLAMVRRRVEPDVSRTFVTGDNVRDYRIDSSESAVFPYGSTRLVPIEFYPGALAWLWPVRTQLWARATFSKKTYKEEGRPWWEWHQVSLDRISSWSITYPMTATGCHFVLDRNEGRVFNRHASFLQLGPDATEEQHLKLLGVLNSSVACFWLKQVSQEKGGDADTPWLRTWEFTGTKLQDFPVPPALSEDRAALIDALAREYTSNQPGAIIERWLTGDTTVELPAAVEEGRICSERLRERLIFEQEELDWEVYLNYGLIDEDLTYDSTLSNQPQQQIVSSERPFAIMLARGEDSDPAATIWFDYRDPRSGVEHRFPRVSEVPAGWDDGYRELTQRRLAVIADNPAIRMLEGPEYKRRWARVPWEKQLQEALESAILDRLEDADLWRDFQGPTPRSVAQLADLRRNDEVLVELSHVLTGKAEPDLGAVITSLAPTEAVSYVAAYRYKPSGLEKFREWQEVWELQRREDSGEKVTIPVPPKFSTPDFQKVEYWKARGKLDVPKERFILYPGVGREGDSSPVLGWAGWNHRDQAVALVREVMTQQSLGVADEALVPLVAGLVELEPWLHQWHTDIEPEFGQSAAVAVTGQIDQFLARLQRTRDDVNAWLPPAATRGRRRAS